MRSVSQPTRVVEEEDSAGTRGSPWVPAAKLDADQLLESTPNPRSVNARALVSAAVAGDLAALERQLPERSPRMLKMLEEGRQRRKADLLPQTRRRSQTMP